MQGVVQGILDLYYDQTPGQNFINWELFKDKFIIILVSDGYKNINSNFKKLAEEKGFFREQAISDTFLKTVTSPDGK